MGVSAEAKEALATLRDVRLARSPSLRVRGLNDVTTFVTSHPAENPAVFKAVLQLVAPTARRYRDRPSQQATIALIDACLGAKSDVTVAAFAALLAAAAADLTSFPSSGLGTAATLLEWTAVALRHAAKALDTAARDEWTALTKVASICLVCLGPTRTRVAARSVRIFQRTLQQTPEIVGLLTAVLKRGPLSPVFVGVVSQLTPFVTSAAAPDGAVEELRPIALDLLLKHVAPSAKAVPSARIRASIAPILCIIGHKDFQDNLLPGLVMSTKRNLMASLPVINEVLKATPLDLSSHAKDLAAIFCEFSRHKEAGVREATASAVALFAKKCSDSEAVEVVFEALLGVLTNKAAKVTQSDCRAAIYNSISQLGVAPLSGVAKAEVSRDAIVKLLGQYTKETSEPATLAAVGAMQSFAAPCGHKTHCSELVEAAIKVLGEAKTSVPLKNAMLLCLLDSFQGEYAAAAVGVCPEVLKIFRGAQGAAASSVRFLAATFLLRVANADPNAQVGVDEAKFATALIGDQVSIEKYFGRFLHAAPQIELLELSLQRNSIVGDDAAKGAALCDAFLSLLIHPSWKTRSQACTRAQSFLRNNASTAIRRQIVAAFKRALAAKAAAAEPLPFATSAFFAAAYDAIAVAEGPECNALAAALLLPGHHPLLVRQDGWSKAIGRSPSWDALNGADDVVAAVVAAMSTDELPSACRAVRTLARRDDCYGVIDGIANAVLKDLADPDFHSVTLHDVDILNTPDGMLASENKSEEDDEIAKLNPNCKDYDEQVWEIKVRRDLAKKKGDKVAKKLTKKEIELRKEKLAEESVVRRRVAVLRARGIGALRVAVELIRARGHYSAERIACAVPMLYSHAQSPLLASEAHQALLDFGQSVDPRLYYLSDSIAHTVLRASDSTMAVPIAWMRSDLKGLVAQTMRRLWAVTNKSGPLDMPSFGFCWPLVQYILMRSSLPGAVLEDALVFLTGHPELGTSSLAPRKGVLRLLAHVADNHDRLALQATTYLRVFVSSMLAMSEDDGGDGNMPVGPPEVTILVDGMMSANTDLRRCSLECLQLIARVQATDDVLASIWQAKHDTDEAIVSSAAAAWESLESALPDTIFDYLLAPLRSYNKDVRHGGASAFAKALEVKMSEQEHVDIILDTQLNNLLAAFEESLEVPEVQKDHLGNPIGPEHIDEWFYRCGIAQTWAASGTLWSAESVELLFTFLVEVALVRDTDSRSQEAVMSAGAVLIDEIAKEGSCDNVLQIINAGLEKQQHIGRADTVKASLVVMLGSVAKHLDKDDPQIPEVIDQLLATLSTPSQTVQEAVGNCISPLVKAVKPRAPAILDRLFDQLLEHDNFGVRRGAAYGIAGVVKGIGILALKQNGVTERLKKAIENKKSARHREGALMAYELLCVRLGRLFEPYIIHVLTDMLNCYGDGNKDVRQAAEETAQAIMSKLSSHGVKLVLPQLLEGIESDKWRTKLGSVELLGAMAFMAPKQLSACLPQIVPRLQNTLSDAHPKVQISGKGAIAKIGSVIKNPEIQAIVPSVLKALDNPHLHAEKCMQQLLETAFEHVIDAPSLALIMPILQRALEERGSALKKAATQIIGTMYTLTDPKDLAPYLPALLPGVKDALLASEPSVRGIASKALGSIVKGMGEEAFPELIPWLLETIKSKSNSVDRSGGAQGLSEVLLALGTDRLESVMDDFVEGTQHPLAHVREGFLMMFIYLPVSFRDEFIGFVGRIIPYLLRGLSDADDGVRSTAMRSAVGIIKHFSETSIALLLPELEKGLLNESWRIRESSVNLLGELMFMLSGLTGKQTTVGDEDESFGTAESEASIIKALGQNRRDRVLAGIFMARQDSALQVRQASAHVWKVVVPHTVRTLRDILPAVISLLLVSLGDDTGDRRHTAARTLSEVLRKLGERILPKIFPILEENVHSEEASTRHGVCVALSEVITSCSVEQLEPYMPVLITTVKASLIDTEEEVRAAASQVFAALHSIIGPNIVEEIVSPLLAEVQENENALDGLRQMIGSKGSFILPLVVPQLLAPPFTANNAEVLSSLAVVAGDALNKHLDDIVDTFMDTIQEDADGGAAELKASLSSLILSLEEDGIDLIVPKLLDTLINGAVTLRRTAAALLADICRDLDEDVSLEEHFEEMIESLLTAFLDADTDVLHGAWGALNALLTARITNNKPKFMRHVVSVLEEITANGEVPGFSMPDGIKPIMTLLVTEGLQSQLRLDDHTKLFVMRGLGYIVHGTGEEALKKGALKITGPVIRVASESTGKLKAECIRVAFDLLGKIPLKLKAMLPQLQPTFQKALRDPAGEVRANAIRALGKLAEMQRRMDPVYADLATGLESAEGTSQRIVFLKAVAAVSVGGGATAGEPTKQKMVEQLEPLLASSDEDVRDHAALAIGCLSKHLPPDEVARLVKKCTSGGGDPAAQHGQALAVRDIVCNADPAAVAVDAVVAEATRLLQSDNVTLQGGGAAIAAAVMARPELAKAAVPLEKVLASSADSPTTTKDWLRCVAHGFGGVALRRAELPDEFVAFSVGLLFLSTKKKSGLVEVETAIGRLLRMGFTDGERARYTAELAGAEAASFTEFCDKRVSRHGPTLKTTLW